MVNRYGLSGVKPRSRVTLLAHLDGANGSTTFTDTAGVTTLTAVGAAALSTTSPKFGTASLRMAAATANTDYVQSQAAAPVCSLGDGAFTVEFWINPDSITTSWAMGSLATIFDTEVTAGSATDWWALHQVNNTLNFSANGGSVLTSSAALGAGAWQHVALVRAGGVITFYVNGVAAGSVANTSRIGGRRRLYIGTQPGQMCWFKGNLDEIRITAGLPRYIGAFTPPITPFS